MVEIKSFEDALRLHRELAQRFEKQIAGARKDTASAVGKMAVEEHEDAVQRATAALAAVEADRTEALKSLDERVERCRQELARAKKQLEAAKSVAADIGKSVSSPSPKPKKPAGPK